MKRIFALISVITVLGGAQSAGAQEILGTFDDWTAFVRGSGAGKVCYIGSSPKKEEGDYTQRGDTYTLVTHRPADRAFGVISVEAGYAYKKDSEVTIAVDGNERRLYTNAGQAWAYDNEDKALIAAMKAGRTMIVKGTSGRGTLTTDTYSLSGFTAAFDAINKACDAK